MSCWYLLGFSVFWFWAHWRTAFTIAVRGFWVHDPAASEVNIRFVSSCEFLGTVINQSSSFSNNIDCVVGKLSRSADILDKIRNLLPINARLNYYFVFMYPYSSYISVWGPQIMFICIH